MDKHPADLYKDHLKPFLLSKLEEFRILGYGDVRIEDLWSFLLNKKWRNLKDVQIYKLADAILAVKIGEFMNYATVESFKTSNLLNSKEGQNLLDELLK
ncbi:post-transcriptional regulator [Bacillus sp. CLL-7-23]|uniref:Post-transcriptional regulator n=1 Tax=Bacillus changyiensis TaxID=3004103 RepID=A0ABT4X892_9BACI|nr:post-transcriptional regulator [Bacillus changyiensis]MDA7027651.1 post-transcriptional regulator [Bacillus changyiensis]